MAWISAVQRKDGNGKIQPTEVIAYAKVFSTEDNTRILQIDTYGSSDRQLPGKQSQTIQFGPEAAAQLFRILKDTYGF
jgi:hypothetical protein